MGDGLVTAVLKLGEENVHVVGACGGLSVFGGVDDIGVGVARLEGGFGDTAEFPAADGAAFVGGFGGPDGEFEGAGVAGAEVGDFGDFHVDGAGFGAGLPGPGTGEGEGFQGAENGGAVEVSVVGDDVAVGIVLHDGEAKVIGFFGAGHAGDNGFADRAVVSFGREAVVLVAGDDFAFDGAAGVGFVEGPEADLDGSGGVFGAGVVDAAAAEGDFAVAGAELEFGGAVDFQGG